MQVADISLCMNNVFVKLGNRQLWQAQRCQTRTSLASLPCDGMDKSSAEVLDTILLFPHLLMQVSDNSLVSGKLCDILGKWEIVGGTPFGDPS